MTYLIFIFIVNLIFIFIFHPLAIIFVLIIQTTLISLIIYFLTQFPWFSYTLILVFLGGILILFIYISNIASNEIFKPNLKIFIPLLRAPFITFLVKNFPQNYRKERNNIEAFDFSNLIVLKPYSDSILPVTILIALYIILTLLAVVKISKIAQGPLRIN